MGRGQAGNSSKFPEVIIRSTAPASGNDWGREAVGENVSATERLGARDAQYPAAAGRLGGVGITNNCPAARAPPLFEKHRNTRTCITIPRITLLRLCSLDLYPKDFYTTQALYFLSNKIKIGRLSIWLRRNSIHLPPSPSKNDTAGGREGRKMWCTENGGQKWWVGGNCGYESIGQNEVALITFGQKELLFLEFLWNFPHNNIHTILKLEKLKTRSFLLSSFNPMTKTYFYIYFQV